MGRLLRVSEVSGTMHLSVGGIPNANNCFALGRFESEMRARVRVTTFGDWCMVLAPMSEDNDMSINTGLSYVVVVASDEGLSVATLNRIVGVIREVLFYLGGGFLNNPQSKSLLLMFLHYIDNRLAANDLSFLNSATERVDRMQSAFTNREIPPHKTLSESLLHTLDEECEPGTRMPTYAVCMMGHKMVLETDPDYTKRANKQNDDKLPLQDSDRYIIALLAAAFYSSPKISASVTALPTELEILEAEQFLKFMGINRSNATRKRTKEVLDRFIAHLKIVKLDKNKREEQRLAENLQKAFDILVRANAETLKPFRQKYHNHDKLTRTEFGGDFEANAHHTYPMYFPGIGDGEDIQGRIQFVWTPLDFGEIEHVECYPRGVATAVLYFPNSSWDPEKNPVIPIDELSREIFRVFSFDVQMEFAALTWLMHPPLEGYAIPGLIFFCYVDRRKNRSYMCSTERMCYDAKTDDGRQAILQLHDTMTHCISEAHNLVAQGFSEGIWGHLGMQFFYQVQAHRNPKKDEQPSQNQQGSPMAADRGQAEVKKLDASLAKTLSEAPYKASSEISESQNMYVSEMYAMFVGSMTPKDVVVAVQELRQKIYATT